jgi:tetratricopeptide (TPR) repeat protein
VIDIIVTPLPMSIKYRAQRALMMPRRGLPHISAILSVILCLWSATHSLGFGLSKLYAARAVERDDLTLADRSVILASSDPEAYRVRALILSRKNKFNEATIDLQRAVQLSPKDPELWIHLGDDLTHLQNLTEAVFAYSNAARLAPDDARAQWLLANCLLNLQRKDEAFAYFRRAVTCKPSLYSDALAIGWTTFGESIVLLTRALPPQTPREVVALSSFLFHQGQKKTAVALLREATPLSEEQRFSLLSDLLASRRFAEAREVWLIGRSKDPDHNGPEQITDGGFEVEFIVDDPGFGWQFQQSQKTIHASLDSSNPHTGIRSLRLDWRGKSDPAVPVVDQLVLVTPRSRYRLSFAARAQELLTGSLPFVTVVECTGNVTESVIRGKVLAQSDPVLPEVRSWRQYSLEFSTDQATEAVFVVVRRENCSASSCPIFGSTWFDDFRLEKLA